MIMILISILFEIRQPFLYKNIWPTIDPVIRGQFPFQTTNGVLLEALCFRMVSVMFQTHYRQDVVIICYQCCFNNTYKRKTLLSCY